MWIVAVVAALLLAGWAFYDPPAVVSFLFFMVAIVSGMVAYVSAFMAHSWQQAGLFTIVAVLAGLFTAWWGRRHPESG